MDMTCKKAQTVEVEAAEGEFVALRGLDGQDIRFRRTSSGLVMVGIYEGVDGGGIILDKRTAVLLAEGLLKVAGDEGDARRPSGPGGSR
jgi:ferredoxin-fold anticodon binding domain-containing protein